MNPAVNVIGIWIIAILVICVANHVLGWHDE